MSIRPNFAEAILARTKLVEFRKRRLAPDVTTVLIYATAPVAKLIGAFEVAGYDAATPNTLWERHKVHAGIARSAYRDYYRGSEMAVGILVRDPLRLARPLRLAELDATLRAPQSFRYLELDPYGPQGEAQARLRAELAHAR